MENNLILTEAKKRKIEQYLKADEPRNRAERRQKEKEERKNKNKKKYLQF